MTGRTGGPEWARCHLTPCLVLCVHCTYARRFGQAPCTRAPAKQTSWMPEGPEFSHQFCSLRLQKKIKTPKSPKKPRILFQRLMLCRHLTSNGFTSWEVIFCTLRRIPCCQRIYEETVPCVLGSLWERLKTGKRKL